MEPLVKVTIPSLIRQAEPVPLQPELEPEMELEMEMEIEPETQPVVGKKLAVLRERLKLQGHK
jgi:hypothetical protein